MINTLTEVLEDPPSSDEGGNTRVAVSTSEDGGSGVGSVSGASSSGSSRVLLCSFSPGVEEAEKWIGRSTMAMHRANEYEMSVDSAVTTPCARLSSWK